jgi:broad specificity phosphatase PhoE
VTSKTDFTDEEWTRLKRAPFVAGMAISLADPGGPIEAVKETAATLRTVLGAAEDGARGELVKAIAGEVAEDARQRRSPLAGFKPSKGAAAGVEILDELREVNELVAQKASPEDAAAVRDWLLDAAREAANAAKEGGFLGFRAERVSEGEQRMLKKLSEVLAQPAA